MENNLPLPPNKNTLTKTDQPGGLRDQKQGLIDDSSQGIPCGYDVLSKRWVSSGDDID
jgi:hypothetical protein